MREIKFRAWNKIENRMIYDSERDDINFWEGVTGTDVQIVNAQLRNSSNVWMQFTGLLDKNEKEIWEGDIVREWSPPDSGFGPCPIVYEIRYYKDGFYFFNPVFDAVVTNWNLRNLAEHYEIIGSIYENENLLH